MAMLLQRTVVSSLRPCSFALPQPKRKIIIIMAKNMTTLPCNQKNVIGLNEVLKRVKGNLDKLTIELPDCSVSGTLVNNACLHRQPNSTWAVFTTLKDEEGTAEVLVGNFALANTAESEARMWFPKGAKVRIVEPRAMMAGTTTLALIVDNPASLEILGFELSTSSSTSKGRAFWSAANEAFANGDYLRAAHLYHESVNQGFPASSQAYARSCDAWMKLGCFERAFLDADKVLAENPTHFHCLFSKAKALCNLREYNRALECFELAESAASELDRKKVLDAKKRCFTLHQQSITGHYDLLSTFQSKSSSQNAPECSDFVGPVRIDVSEGKGRGLFATDDLKSGDLILVSNAITQGTPGEELLAKMGRCCMKNRKVIAQLTAFFGEQELRVPDMDLFRPNSNWYWKNRDHLRPSAHYRDLLKGLGKRTGLCPLGTLINHSCIANVSRRFVGAALVIRAARDIKKGEELTTGYFDPFVPLSVRRRLASEKGFKFVCNCERCLAEEKIEHKQPDRALKYEQAMKGTDAAKSLAESVQLAEGLDSLVQDKRVKQWIIASYSYAFWAWIYFSKPGYWSRETRLEQVVAAVHATAPGHVFTLPKMVEVIGGNDMVIARGGRVKELLVQEVISRFGKQSPKITDSLIFSPPLPDKGDDDVIL